MPTQAPKASPKESLTSRTPALPLRFLSFFRAPWMWLGFSALVLVLDYLFGPFVHLSILFVFPVAAAAWHRGLRFSLPLSLLLPWFRLMFYSTWNTPWTWVDSGVSCLTRAIVLVAFAVLTAHLRRQTDEIRLLRGLFPICSHCKKIRDREGTWHPIETYLSRQIEARFTHGICPDCLKAHYGEYTEDSGAVLGRARDCD